MKFALIYITNPTKSQARKIALYLLSKKLIVCANVHGPVNSMYPWKGRIADETEYILIVKTAEENFRKVKEEVEKIHSYTIPCIIKIPVVSNKKYFQWLKSQLV